MEYPFLTILGDKDIELMQRTVVIRWSGPITPAQVCVWLAMKKFEMRNKTGEPADGWPVENEKVIFVEMDSYETSMRLVSIQNDLEYFINEHRLRINRLIQVHGISIRDSIDYLNMCSYCGNDESFYECLVELLTIFDVGKKELNEQMLHVLIQMFLKFIYKPKLMPFGSFSSPLRRLASSDLDITFFMNDSPNDETDPNLAYCRTAEELTPDKFDTVLTQPLNKKEIESLPKDLIIRIIFHCFKSFENISNNFIMHYTSNARTPLLVMKYNDGRLNTSIDISVNNEDGVLKARLLHTFIEKDNSAGKKIRQIIVFFIHWTRCNKLMNGVYAEEKYNKKCGFNSYILTHMVIHFVQVFSKQKIIHKSCDPDKCVIDYNIDDMFPSVNEFLREFFKYLSRFDWTNDAIYVNRTIPKNIVRDVHNIKVSPMIIVDPCDLTHNIASRVSLEELNKLKQLLCNSLLILKKKNMRAGMLLEVNRHATAILLEKAKSRTCERNGNFLHFSLPDIIQTSTEFMVLLNSVIRFDVSTEHVGTSNTNLFTTMGVTFVVYGRAWIGRRGMRRKVKNSAENLSNLQLELMISKSFEFSYDEPIAIVNITLSEVEDSKKKIAHFDVICGDVVEIRNAMHFLLDQFIVNNLEELTTVGIMSLMSM